MHLKKKHRNLNVPYVYSCSSGTAALHLAFLSIGLNKKDTIIIPAINFILICKFSSPNEQNLNFL